MRAVPVGDVRGDFGLGEIPDDGTEGLMVFGELEQPNLLSIDLYVYVKQTNRVSAVKRERTWTVRELADELGVTTRTLRFYEAEGLVSPERRGTVRIYHPRDHGRLILILRGKRFGMSLPEIREIVEMYDGAASSEQRQLETLLGRLSEIAIDLTERQHDIDRILAEIDSVSARCRVRLAELSPPPPGRRAPHRPVSPSAAYSTRPSR